MPNLNEFIWMVATCRVNMFWIVFDLVQATAESDNFRGAFRFSHVDAMGCSILSQHASGRSPWTRISLGPSSNSSAATGKEGGETWLEGVRERTSKSHRVKNHQLKSALVGLLQPDARMLLAQGVVLRQYDVGSPKVENRWFGMWPKRWMVW